MRTRVAFRQRTDNGVEDRIKELGIDVPDLASADCYGLGYGNMKPHHIFGNVLFLSGYTPIRDGKMIHPGRLETGVSIEQGYEPTRITAINMVAGVKPALGDFDRVKGVIGFLCFVACEPDFAGMHKVSSRRTCQ